MTAVSSILQDGSIIPSFFLLSRRLLYSCPSCMKAMLMGKLLPFHYIFACAELKVASSHSTF